MNELNRLHEVEVEILDYIVQICDENSLQYLLVYGTALGAFRHQGFIPWDDDIDIAMPEEDYTVLKKIIEKDNSQFVFQDMYSEENYYMLFGKVRKRNTLFVESIAEKPLKENGIYVDVFPLYSVCKENVNIRLINYLKHIVKFSTHRNLYREKDPNWKYLLNDFLSIPVFFMGPKKILYYLNKYINNRTDYHGDYIAEFDENGKIQVIDKNIYFATKKLMFEGKKYNVPGKIEEYLTIAYGENYMILPPEDQRHTHTPSKIDFGK